MRHRILIAAGGTGGHIMPGLAIAQEMQARGWDVSWIGTSFGMEASILEKQPISFHPITISGIRKKGTLSKCLLPVRLPLMLARAMWQTASIMRKCRPAIVLTFGGYVSFPVGVIAKVRRCPLVVHEQNAIAGLTNRCLTKLATRTLEGFAGTLFRGIHTGNPLRHALLSQDTPPPASRYAQRQGPLRLLIVGGSLGAAVFNQRIPQAIAALSPQDRPTIVHQVGRGNHENVATAYAQAGIQAQVEEFISDMAQAYQDADLVIARAGALTLAEITQIGVASVLVPYPHAVDDHQTLNAQHLVAANAAHLMAQEAFTPANIAQFLLTQTRKSLSKTAERASKFAQPDATRRIADICVSVARPQL